MLLELNEQHLSICAWSMIGLGIFAFVCSFFLTTPYGRYSRDTWGFGVNARLAWFLQECPSFVTPFVLFTSSGHKKELMSFNNISPNLVLIFMFLIHYFRRAFLYPLSMKKTADTPFLIFLFALLFCMVNGFMQGHYLANVGHYHKDWFYTLEFCFGIAIFFLGFAINVHSDYILTNLRKPGETGYRIPQGGLFCYVSCANFFGEIVEWGGFALASCSFPAFAFFFSTMCMIGPRACHHHRFYQEKFDDYPKDRKAIIPFLF